MHEAMGKGILIVDDSATTRSMIKRVLRMVVDPEVELVEAGDGAAALEVLNRRAVGLVMTDLNMPTMDGYALIKRMRESETLRPIAVVVISAQPDMERVLELKRQGVRGYLAKPFTPEAVRDLLAPLQAA